MKKTLRFIRDAVVKASVWITLCLVIMSAAIIFGFSAQNAEKSTETSNTVVDIVIDVTKPGFEELPAQEQEVIYSKTSHHVRKMAHFTEYAIFGFFLMLHLNTVGYRATADGGTVWEFGRLHNPPKRKYYISTLRFGWLGALIFGILYAVTDEIHQIFVDDRGPGFIDVLIDSAGVISGILVLALIWYLAARQAKKKEL